MAAARRVLGRDEEVVRARVRRADSGAGARLAGDRGRRARSHPGADRLGEDARGVPPRHRPAERDARRGAATALRLSAQGPQLRHRAQPAQPARGARSKLSVAVRTGDTPADERRRMLRTPPDILITTPESLFLLLTSQARETLRGIETVILDEVHAVAGTKRGAHLALSLERLERLVERPFQRVGLSATQRPLEEIGRFVAGAGREIELVDAGSARSSTSRSSSRSRTCASSVDRRALVPPLADGVEMGVGRGAVEPLDLALDLPRDPRARPRAPLDDRLRQQPPPRRAPRAAHQRARRRGARARAPRLARAGAAPRRRGAAEGRARSRVSSRRRRSSSASTWARSTS